MSSKDVLSGVFAGPVAGLKYETATLSGVTDEKGRFQYREGESITFFIGETGLGPALAAPRLTLAHLHDRTAGSIDKIKDPELVNMARLLQTLDRDGKVEGGITIDPKVHEIVGKRFLNFLQLDLSRREAFFMVGASGGTRPFGIAPNAIESFGGDKEILRLLEDLNNTPGVFTGQTPRTLRSPAAAVNELRRNLRGIIKSTDVKIPLRDGTFLLADVFRPDDDAKHPPILAMSTYGKASLHGCICNPEGAEQHEKIEDDYFSGNLRGDMWENHETANTAEWIPRGYVVVRIETRGTGKSTGTHAVWSHQEAQDYYDAIEWAARQPWSNGNVGLWGMSYTSMTQIYVAQLQPPSLKAMVSIATDINLYEEAFFTGGMQNLEFFRFWWEGGANPHCVERPRVDVVGMLQATPFNEPFLFSAADSVCVKPDMSKVNVPLWVLMPQTHAAHVHQLGSSETFIHANSKHKKLDIVEHWFATAYRSAGEHMDFFDHWLKGMANGIMDGPPVRLQVRTGNGNYFVQHENEWPIARTEYTRLYLDAAPSAWRGDGRRKDVLRLSKERPNEERNASYSAEVNNRALGTEAAAATGTSFVTEPLQEDWLLAGYMKLGLWVSSTSADMDLVVSVRVIGADDREINYAGAPFLAAPHEIYPVGFGALKVSHRKVDESRTTVYTVKHTHRRDDHAPLEAGEVVPVEVEIWPSSALIKKGSRIRLDVQPYNGCGHGAPFKYEESYHQGAQNSLYTGPQHPAYLQLPIVPRR